jgi:hypothetical protein
MRVDDDATITSVRVLESRRTIPLSRWGHITGSIPVGGVSISFESSLERDFIHLVSIDRLLVSIVSQPVTLAFLERGTTRRYTPDFLVHRLQAPPELTEIKYEADLIEQSEYLRGAFAAAKRWCGIRGWNFVVQTEREIRNPRLGNARRLFRFRNSPMDLEKRAELLTRLDRPTPIAELRLGPDLLPTLWGLIARGEILVPLDVPITPSTLARRPWRPFS